MIHATPGLKRIPFSLFFLFLFTSLYAQIPAGYYDGTIGKTGAELKTALYNIIKGHTQVSYTPGVWNAFYSTDKKPNGNVWDMYSDIPGGTPPYEYTFGADQCGTSTQEGDCYSREHSMPQSYFNGASPMYTDLHHLFPVDQYVNGTGHNNYPFGTVSSPAYTSQNGSKRGPCSYPGYTGTVFEPRDEYKGDFARAYLYMATRYENLISGWPANDPNADVILDGTSYPAFETWFKNLLQAWNSADPVSTKETARNDSIYKIQNNRNPYIDHPEYVAAVWSPGGPKAEPSNHAAGFSAAAGNPPYSVISLSWTDAAGAVLPDGYLIKGSTVGYDDISLPADGTAVADGGLNKNVPYGSQAYAFTGLSASTTYYFKIFSYTNSGADINYKTDGTIQSANATTSAGASTLQAGDIAIIEFNSIDPDKFSFIIFKQISAGTVINFTDNGFSSATTARTGEGFLSYSAPSTISAGTVVSWSNGMPIAGTGWSSASPSNFAFAEAGDQLFAYQGTWGTDQSLIYGVNAGNSGWIISGTATSNTSYLPSALTNNVTALTFSQKSGNYNLITTGTTNALKSLISGPANWTTSGTTLPTPSWNFGITPGTTISSNATVQNLTIASGEILTIPAGKQLTVNGTLTNNGGPGGFVISSDASGTGSLIHNSNYIPATVNRYVTGASYAWHLLSSPVSMAIAGSGFVPGGSDYDFYCWDEPTAIWVNYKNTTTEPAFMTVNGSDFVPGRGYLVAYQALNPTKQFQGSLNNGTIGYDLSRTGSGTFTGANLLGNPYPSAIDWKASSGWTRTSITNNGGGYDMWIWNDAAGNYGVFNSAGSGGTNGVTQYIPVGQGFFVMTASAGTLTMTNAVRVHQNPGYLKSSEGPGNVLKLKVSTSVNSYSDEAIIEFGHETSQGGAAKWTSMYDDAPGLYITSDGEDYSIRFLGAPAPQPVPLSLSPGTDGYFRITASLLESFHPGTTITLEDKKSGLSQNLMINPGYVFSAVKNDDPDRFVLHFGGAIGIAESSAFKDLSIYGSGGSLFIVSNLNKDLSGSVEIFNMPGQLLLSNKLSGNPLSKITPGLPSGYYIVRVITPESVYSAKVLLR